MMDLAMNFDTDECLVVAMFDKGCNILITATYFQSVF